MLTHSIRNSFLKIAAETRTPRTKLERRVNPYSSQPSSSSYSGSEPAKNLSVHLVLATHRPPYGAFALWNWMQLGLRRETYLWLRFPMRVINILKSSTNINPFHSHMISHPNTHHISSHSLIGMDNSLSSMSQRPEPDHTLKSRGR
jgi:hypothetical protein